MNFLLTLLGTILACFLLRTPLKKYPWVFYGVAIALDIIFISGAFYSLPKAVWGPLYLLVQKCMLPLALFVVVMYIGVFPKTSAIRQQLQPIRGELSIVAWLLCLAHMTVYLMSYAPRVLTGGMSSVTVVAGLAIALILFVLLLILGLTSFKAFKHSMKPESWKKIQLLAYPFFALVYVHLSLMLMPSALGGGQAACTTLVIYTWVFGLYAILRIARAYLDSKNSKKHA